MAGDVAEVFLFMGYHKDCGALFGYLGELLLQAIFWGLRPLKPYAMLRSEHKKPSSIFPNTLIVSCCSLRLYQFYLSEQYRA